MTYPELTIDPKTDEDYQSGGFWEGDSYTLTGDPEDFNLHAGVQEKDFYSIVYLEFEGKVPLESFVVPGGIILGCDYEGQTIELNFYYTVNPETYRARLHTPLMVFRLTASSTFRNTSTCTLSTAD